MAWSESFCTNARNSPRLQAFFFFPQASSSCIYGSLWEPETDDLFLYSHNIWTLCLKEPGDSYPEVLYLLPRPRKWTDLWADLYRYMLVTKEQVIHRGYACSQSKANRDVRKDTLLSLVRFSLDLITHYRFLLPNIASSTTICYLFSFFFFSWWI